MEISIAGIVKESFTDGQGIRYAIFVQGCAHKCPGCQNPETWEFSRNNLMTVDELIADIKDDPMLDGVTFSGGDPFYQSVACTELAKRIKTETNLNIWCYTGFKFEELLNNKEYREFLNYIDVLVDGPYVEKLKSLELYFRGSKNQRIIDVKNTLSSGKIIELKFK
ncbi:MAG: anaerobic ribonucleoside-triphosphate reductase activating protein [Lachnospiraceae bacterium]|nr:anaerobic ribonucleoside-triphosphate reductase activating protein [Lachnospiraceae bacterium]